MTTKSGVYVRAKDQKGKWVSVLAERLTDESFRQFILRQLVKAGLVVAVRDENEVLPEYQTEEVLE